MKIQIRNIARGNVKAIKALVNTTFGALPKVTQSYQVQCWATNAAEGYAVICNEYYDHNYLVRDSFKQELCERNNPYNIDTQLGQYRGFEMAQAHLRDDRLSWANTRPVMRHELQYEVDTVDQVLMLRFVANLLQTFSTVEINFN